jgi:hypothetical protein
MTKTNTLQKTKTNPKRRFFSFQTNDPALNILDLLKQRKFPANSDIEIIKLGLSLLAEQSNLTDLTEDKIDWENISTQELIERYKPYRDQFLESTNNTKTTNAFPKATNHNWRQTLELLKVE